MRAWALWLVAALVLGACAAANSDSAANSGGASGSPVDASRGGSSGSGGATSGSGGSSASGTGGSGGGAGGSSEGSSDAAADGAVSSPPDASAGGEDAAASDDGGVAPSNDAGGFGDALGTACAISISPVSPARFTDIPAGDGRKLRVSGQAVGYQVPEMPTWVWHISHASGLVLTPEVVDGDPAVVEFPTAVEGLYKIEAEISGVVPTCTGGPVTANAILPDRRVAQFRLLATPPAAVAAAKKLIPLETDVLVAAGTDTTKTLELQPGYPITIDPKDSEHGLGLPAYYVQITSKTSLEHVEGYVAVKPNERTAPFSALLQLGRRYDLLLISDGGTLRAPLFYGDLFPEQFGLQEFRVDPGVRLFGGVSTAAGPLVGARVRLRSGALPSTVGVSGATGAYELRARAGRNEVRVLPPEGSGLPEALVPQSTGVLIPASDLGLDFVYADLGMVALTVTVTGPGATPATSAIDVTLDAVDGALATAGVLTLATGTHLNASGVVHVTATTTGGVAHFDHLPRTRYRVTLVPPADRPGGVALTSTEIDLTGATAAVARTVALAARGHISGQVTPAGGGGARSIRAIDSGPDGLRPSFTAAVGADGKFDLAVDPGRLYRLFLEPPTDRRGPRVPLDPVRATGATVTVNPAVPASRTISGKTTADGAAVPGTLIQLYCLGDAPDCIDPEAVDVSNTPAIDETVSDADGAYTVYLPDPGR